MPATASGVERFSLFKGDIREKKNVLMKMLSEPGKICLKKKKKVDIM